MRLFQCRSGLHSTDFVKSLHIFVHRSSPYFNLAAMPYQTKTLIRAEFLATFLVLPFVRKGQQVNVS